jgi:thiosulfate/3-mercaptopyruvate sulfurtransferase
MKVIVFMKAWIFVLISALFLSGCQQAPTKAFEQAPTRIKTPKISQADLANPDSVIFDVRPTLEFQTSKIPNSVQINPADFYQNKEPFLGLLQPDLYALARKLATFGVDENTEIVVVGKGAMGNGEDGQLAWTLQYMGVKNVKIDNVENYDRPVQELYAKPVQQKPIWKPVLNQDMMVSLDEFKKKLKAFATREVILIDVRSEAEYLRKAQDVFSKQAPDLGAFNIEWKKFIQADGSPNENVALVFKSLNIKKDQEIILISNKGVRSAFVTYVLRESGYKKARNFSGGYMLLLQGHLPLKRIGL